jgi:hypothetical protein
VQHQSSQENDNHHLFSFERSKIFWRNLFTSRDSKFQLLEAIESRLSKDNKNQGSLVEWKEIVVASSVKQRDEETKLI